MEPAVWAFLGKRSCDFLVNYRRILKECEYEEIIVRSLEKIAYFRDLFLCYCYRRVYKKKLIIHKQNKVCFCLFGGTGLSMNKVISF